MNSKLARIAAVVTVAGIVLFGTNAATAAQTVPAKSITKAQLAPDVSKELEYGKGSVVKVVPEKTIRNIGGKFADRKTLLSIFLLARGTWLITTNATFNRTVSAPDGATKTRPMLALRTAAGDAGTIMGVDISPTKGRELKGATVQTVTVTGYHAPIVVDGFGYNDDGSDYASGQITVSAQITATRIG